MARSARSYLLVAVGISMSCGVLGLIVSYYINTSAGAAVVLICALVYFVTLPMRRR